MDNQEIKDLELVKRDKNYYLTLPDERRTEQVTLAAVEAYPPTIRYIPEDKLSKKIIEAALNEDGALLELIPDGKKTPEICMYAVKNNGMALEFVPEALRTKKMCRTAIHSVPFLAGEECQVLAFIPHSDVCFEGLKKFGHSMSIPYEVFGSIRTDLITQKMAEYAVKLDAVNYQLVPDPFKTPEMAMKAVKEDAMILGSVPEKERTKELCEAAIDRNFHSLKHVPHHLFTDELCEQALKKSPFAIQYFPLDKLTHEYCRVASEKAQYPWIVQFIPYSDIHNKVLEKFDDYSMIHYFLSNLNPAYMTQETANKVFEKEPALFYRIPEIFKTKDLCEAAVKHDGSYLKYVPDNQKTRELCELAVQQSPYAIPYILDTMKGVEQYTEMVKQNPENLNGIPKEDRTDAMCRMSLDNTFGKDKNDFSVIRAITSPSMLLEVFTAHEGDPEQINRLLIRSDKDVLTPEIAKLAMQSNGSNLDLLPQKVITQDVAENAIKNAPTMLARVPENLRTADMYLYTKKAIPDYNIIIPNSILNGDNIYAFSKKVEGILNAPLSYEQHKKLYNGEKITIENVQTPGGLVKIGVLQYNPESKKLNIKSVGELKESKQNKETIQKNKPEKKNKGRKV